MRLVRLIFALAMLAISAAGVNAQSPVYDGITGAALAIPTATRTYMGQGFSFNSPDGQATTNISSMAVSLASATTANYDNIRVRVQFWGTFTPNATGTTPVFSNSLANLTFTGGAFSATANTATTFTLPINGSAQLPGGILALPSGTSLGVTINWQAGTADPANPGSFTYADTDNLTTTVRGSTSTPLAAGTNVNPGNTGYYRNASGRTDFNFLATDGRTLGANGGLVFSLTPVPEPATCLLAGSLALGALGYARRRTGRATAVAVSC